jgi:hypothetical protein
MPEWSQNFHACLSLKARDLGPIFENLWRMKVSAQRRIAGNKRSFLGGVSQVAS